MTNRFDELTKGCTQPVTCALLVMTLSVGGLLAAFNTAQGATLTVLNTLDKGAGSLRGMIANAQNGDIVVFDSRLAGQTITLTSDQLSIKRDLDIEGPGADLLTISGNDTARVFDIAEGSTVRIAGLSIAHGFAQVGGGNDHGAGGGGGILNAGNLTIANAVLSRNEAKTHGAGIANAKFATLTVANSTFIGNRAVAKNGFAEGGAIYNSNAGAVAYIVCSTFISNQGIGADGGVFKAGFGATGQCNGGALHNGGTSILVVETSTFIGNQALGGNGGNVAGADAYGFAGSALGGAIANDETCVGGYLVVRGCTFAYNEAVGGSNNVGSATGSGYVGSANGGAISPSGVESVITDCTFIGNEARGGNGNTGGSGVLLVGTGMGGAINSGGSAWPFFGCGVSLTVSRCSFTGNRAVGGSGNSGGVFTSAGIGGAFLNLGEATVANSTLRQNQAIGGTGGVAGKGGDALGGAIANFFGLSLNTVNSLNVADSTVSGNETVGGAGGAGANGGDALGGGLFTGYRSSFPDHTDLPSALALLTSSISSNRATGGTAGVRGRPGLGLGGGTYVAIGGSACRDPLTSISANAASSGDNNVFGLLSICPSLP